MTVEYLVPSGKMFRKPTITKSQFYGTGILWYNYPAGSCLPERLEQILTGLFFEALKNERFRNAQAIEPGSIIHTPVSSGYPA